MTIKSFNVLLRKLFHLCLSLHLWKPELTWGTLRRTWRADGIISKSLAVKSMMIFFALSKHRLKRFRNVELSLASSEEFIMNLVENKRLGNLPLFFLDAHWHDYWPLVDEIAAISSSRSTAIVIVDDFEVPDRPEFSYCVGGGSESFSGRAVIDQRVCGLDLIKPKMIRSNTYNALFPSYTRENAFPGGTGTLTGHIVIFQNLKDGFELFKRREFISQNYEHFSILLE